MGKRLLDLYSKQGGAARGYELAGFTEILCVDIEPQPRNPYPFVQSDAIEFLIRHGHEFHFIHTSPPCQLDSDTQRLTGNDYPDLIGPTRDALEKIGVPGVIENVGGAIPKLRDPVELCGSMFGLSLTYRHRYFEPVGWSLKPLSHPKHTRKQAKMGRSADPGEVIQAIGHYAGVGRIRAEWGVPWMDREGTAEAIPPVYSKYIGEQFLSQQ